MKARFLGCAVALIGCLILWSKFFFLVLVHKRVWCSFSSLSIQTGVWAVTLRITLMFDKVCNKRFEGKCVFCCIHHVLVLSRIHR